MELLKQSMNIDFMGRRRLMIAMSISAVFVLISIASLIFRGLELGLDFTGGVVMEVGFDQPADLERIRSTLQAAGYEGATVQNFGAATEVLIRLQPEALGVAEDVGAAAQVEAAGVLATTIIARLREMDPSAVERRPADYVGPQIGDELVEQGGQAMLYAILGIFVYVVLRFRWKFAVGAIVALLHDLVITFGFFSVLRLEFDLTVLAAVLAVIGYSLNDTVVVFDRIRENFRLMRRGTSEAIINAAINQTLTRTVVTGVTTLLVLSALYFLGGTTLAGFSIALIVGIIVGTYSSIYVASAAALFLNVSTVDMLPPKREAVDDMP